MLVSLCNHMVDYSIIVFAKNGRFPLFPPTNLPQIIDIAFFVVVVDFFVFVIAGRVYFI